MIDLESAVKYQVKLCIELNSHHQKVNCYRRIIIGLVQFHPHKQLNNFHSPMVGSIHRINNFMNKLHFYMQMNIHHVNLHYYHHTVPALALFRLHIKLNKHRYSTVGPSLNKNNSKNKFRLHKQMNNHHEKGYYYHHIVIDLLENHHRIKLSSSHLKKVDHIHHKNNFHYMLRLNKLKNNHHVNQYYYHRMSRFHE